MHNAPPAEQSANKKKIRCRGKTAAAATRRTNEIMQIEKNLMIERRRAGRMCNFHGTAKHRNFLAVLLSIKWSAASAEKRVYIFRHISVCSIEWMRRLARPPSTIREEILMRAPAHLPFISTQCRIVLLYYTTA